TRIVMNGGRTLIAIRQTTACIVHIVLCTVTKVPEVALRSRNRSVGIGGRSSVELVGERITNETCHCYARCISREERCGNEACRRRLVSERLSYGRTGNYTWDYSSTGIHKTCSLTVHLEAG